MDPYASHNANFCFKSHPNNSEQKLTKARTQLLLNQPFFGTLCVRLKPVPGPVPTMATNGRVIVYNPEFVKGLTAAELEAVVAHETLHCALGHHCRRGERDPELWNEAADLAINPILVANKFTLPTGALLDPAFENLSAEEIYARRLRASSGANAPASSSSRSDDGAGGNGARDKTPQSQAACGAPSPNDSKQGTPTSEIPTGASAGGVPEPRPGGFGEVLDATDNEGNPASPAEKNRQQQEWSIAAEQAIRSAKSCGHEAANLERPLRESRESRQDWRAILREFVAAVAPSDYRWSPPNRRYIASGLYLPSIERRGVGPVVIAVDTSGSIGTDELEQFAGEISAIAEEAQPEAIHVVYCDAMVQSSREFRPSEPIRLAPKGGGGTDFRPVFTWLEQNELNPVCLIYLTDLCCDSFPEPPDYPVLWATNSRRTAPFGETVRIFTD
jgi:predicted metal-dependent peptidase